MQYKSGCSWKERKWNEKAVSEEVWPSNWQAASLKITVLEIESKNVLQIRMGRIPDNPWAEHLGWLRWREGICPESHSFVDKHRPHHVREKTCLEVLHLSSSGKGKICKTQLKWKAQNVFTVQQFSMEFTFATFNRIWQTECFATE